MSSTVELDLIQLAKTESVPAWNWQGNALAPNPCPSLTTTADAPDDFQRLQHSLGLVGYIFACSLLLIMIHTLLVVPTLQIKP